MNLKIAILKINNLRILRLQGFKVRNASFRRILTMNPRMVEHAPHPGPLPIGSADAADAEREKRSQRQDVGKRQGVQRFKARNFIWEKSHPGPLPLGEGETDPASWPGGDWKLLHNPGVLPKYPTAVPSPRGRRSG